ncbi:hypothetical protein H5410_063427 [Solanum commersonii]|uniref:Uncharacterized protein n=1 Tax=Solanum commersonii TaxID=4109 RepID=A0A9J5WDT4_SOLCO|nr:hypothetical protein H5410_063427 [Solanum commersonii]
MLYGVKCWSVKSSNVQKMKNVACDTNKGQDRRIKIEIVQTLRKGDARMPCAKGLAPHSLSGADSVAAICSLQRLVHKGKAEFISGGQTTVEMNPQIGSVFAPVY